MRTRATIGGLIVLLALVTSVVVAASPAFAASCGHTQGQSLLIGCDNNTATDATHLSSPANNSAVLYVAATGLTTSTGLVTTGSATGVYAEAGDQAVVGQGGAVGVRGSGAGSGGIGVSGTALGTGSIGVSGESDTAGGYGVTGRAADGTGVLADSANGTALQVSGKAVFSRSGTATVLSGAKSIMVTMSGVTGASMILATVQQAGAFYVKNAVPAAGSFTIYLNKAPASPATVKVAYFVLN